MHSGGSREVDGARKHVSGRHCGVEAWPCSAGSAQANKARCFIRSPVHGAPFPARVDFVLLDDVGCLQVVVDASSEGKPQQAKLR